MDIKTIRNYLMATAIVCQIALLIWESLNGGVVTHHFLAREDMPGLSNWWGLVILPFLVWITAYSIEKRSQHLQDNQDRSKFHKAAYISFLAMLVISIAQSTIFSLGYSTAALSILMAITFISLFLPLYRIEAIVGYVLGGAYFTGPMIPFVGVVIFVVVSVFAHFCIKPLIIRLKAPKTAAE
ncbi:hypothetical protein [Pseudoalteromonas luteoviolacea]|uniref:Uncharacterized protein n=1 Tax=Pseudoalteromonas luteoviolacea (strain 2ta16) TaxID=1353533 RepID=V4HLM7_PSEL2|nr:hypothetical protein [Pseudoalteromonas luteoviolacea]ESP91745.1 hypothetical protein PL2TA16_05386 [Pseudoalteromonas luteoviolacea 2ta16]KZN40775.1 hypothetical protein N483_16740 [Pseudoalteromonas luteoviolacea NCIMB 1944]